MTREQVSPELAAAVLFRAERTCCVCRIPGKRLQIHHIDGDSSNSVFDNLAPLCFDCHDLTQLSGGFGRHLKPAEVRMNRDDWLARVDRRRDAADRMRVEAMAGLPKQVTASDSLAVSVVEAVGISEGTSGAIGVGEAVLSTQGQVPEVKAGPGATAFAKQLPELRRRAYLGAKDGWGSGVTSDGLNATYTVIDAMQGALAMLATYFPPSRLNGQAPSDYFSELIASRFRWRRMTQPLAGTMAEQVTGGEVLADVEQMVIQMVRSLILLEVVQLDFETWRTTWNEAVE